MCENIDIEIEAIRTDYGEIFCIVYGENITEEDVLLEDEEIRSAALEEALTPEEEEIILNSIFEIIPCDEGGGFYVEFVDFK